LFGAFLLLLIAAFAANRSILLKAEKSSSLTDKTFPVP